MRSTPRLALATFLVVGLVACGTPEKIDPPLNPNPSEAYVFEVWTEGAPRPMAVDSISAWYQVVDPTCLPSRPISGSAAVSWNHVVPVANEALDGGRYRAVAYADLLVGSDLYGKGECRWLLTNVEAVFTDGSLGYRTFHGVGASSDESSERAYTAFSKVSRGWSEAGDRFPMAPPLHSGTYSGEFPSTYIEDPSLDPKHVPRRTNPDAPVRQLRPEDDFLILSEGRPNGGA